MRINYQNSIDGLRAISILIVLLYHLNFSFIPYGYIGVDVFFVISGYLITSVIVSGLGGGKFSIVDFFVRRIKRLLPAALAVTLLSLLIGTVLLFPADLIDLAKSSLWTAFSAANVYFLFTGGYFAGPSEFKPLLHMWSLGVEEQFYVFLAIYCIVIYRFFKQRLLFFILLAFVGSLGLCVLIVDYNFLTLSDKFAFLMMPTRAWELLAGSILAVASLKTKYTDHRLFKTAAPALGLIGVLLILSAAIGLRWFESFPGLGGLQPVIGALLILSVSGSGGSINQLLAAAPMRWTGRLSYSLYLVHWPLISFTHYYLQRDFTLVEQFLLATISFVLAFILWLTVETRFRAKSEAFVQAVQPDLLDRMAARIKDGHAKALWFVAAMMSAIILYSGVAIFYQGMPSRFSESRFSGSLRPADTSASSISGTTTQTKSGTVYFIGDSQVGRVAEAFTFANPSVQVEIRGRPGCPPILGVENPSFTAYGCSAALEESIQKISTDPNVQAVLLVARWSFYAQGAGYDSRGVYLEPSSKQSAAFKDNVSAIQEGLEKTLDALPKHVKVYFFLPTPEQNTFVPLAVQIAERYQRKIDVAVLKSDYLERRRPIDEIIAGLSKTHQFAIIDPSGSLCDQNVCSGVDGDRLLFDDDDHLSEYGARKLAPTFAGFSSK